MGKQVHAIIPVYGPSETITTENVCFIRLGRRSFVSFAILQILTVFCLPCWLRKYPPDTVYVRTCFFSFLMYPICYLAGIPLIAEVDAIVDDEVQMRCQWKTLGCIIRLLDKLNYRLVNGLACATSGIRDEVIRRGANPDTAVVIQNAVDTRIMRPMTQGQARRQLGLDEQGNIVGFAGTFSPWQGLDLLVQAAKQVVDNSPAPVRFVLVGDGQSRPQIQRMVEQAGLGQYFSFLEPMDYKHISVFNSASDVTVIPIYDPRKLRYGISPLKFWDAVSVGVPVLVPAGCGLDDVLEHLALPGTFRSGDKDHLGESIVRVLEQTKHYQSRRKEVHQIVCEHYSWTGAAESLMQLCSQLSKAG